MHDTQTEDTRAWSLRAKSTRHGPSWEAKYAYCSHEEGKSTLGSRANESSRDQKK